MQRPAAGTVPRIAAPERRRAFDARQAPVLETAFGAAFLFVYLLAVFLPGSFSLGPLRLTPYKFILVLAFVPLALRWIGGRAGRVTAPDVLFLLFCLWVAFATLAVHGPSQIFYVGSTFVEYFGAYLVGRVVVRNAGDYARFFRYFLYVLVVMLPFALVEALTRVRLLSDLVGLVLSTGEYRYENRPRLGITRVAVGFSHPILWGVVCGLGFANVYYIYKGSLVRQVRAIAFVFLMTFLSVSSGPLLAVLIQGMMIGWDRIFRIFRSRWVVAAALGAATLLLLQMLLPGGIFGYLVNEVIFNPYGGLARIVQFQYGAAEVLRNPFFGIGLNDWARPYWQHGSVDNFWLLVAMRHGLPAFVLLVLAIGVQALITMARQDLDETESRYRAGYLIAFAGLVVALGTVHIWGGALVFVMTYIGAGGWLYAREAPPRSRMAQPRRSAEAGRPARPERPAEGPGRGAGRQRQAAPTRRGGGERGRPRGAPG